MEARRARVEAGLQDDGAHGPHYSEINDRAANAIGTVPESMYLRGSVDFRQALGFDRYPSARYTLQD